MKSKSTAYLLWFFFGALSAHLFYLDKPGRAIIYLLTGQLCGIGWFIDLFLISEMVDNANDKTEDRFIKRRTLYR